MCTHAGCDIRIVTTEGMEGNNSNVTADVLVATSSPAVKISTSELAHSFM